MSIVSICLPGIFSFVKRGVQGGPYSLLTSKNEASPNFDEQRLVTAPFRGQRPGGLHGQDTSVERLYDNGRVNQYSARAFKSPSLADSPKTEEEIPIEAIRVQRDLNVSVQR